ncbi:MAG: nucleotidyltransferase domain-containing protein [Candidatus Scalindua sp.]
MVNKDSIKHVARDMAISINAERVILFGSYARGDATEQSDVDLMIIAKSNLPRFKRSRELYKLLRPHPFAMDIVVYTPHEVEKGKKTKVSFVSTVLKEGKTLYVRRNRSQQAMDSESKK